MDAKVVDCSDQKQQADSEEMSACTSESHQEKLSQQDNDCQDDIQCALVADNQN